MATDEARQIGRGVGDTDQFLIEVFPAELEEIAKRQTAVFGGLQPGMRNAASEAPELAEEPEKRSFLQKFQSVFVKVPSKPKTRFQDVKPSTKLGLVGLAFSGGGIRSATFNLGVTQALAKHGTLKHIDYLSTVSGGGYIGSCLSSALNDEAVKVEDKSFPFGAGTGPEESLAVKHLRNSGNYLAPGGLADKIRIPALLLRGILINLLVVLPYIVATVWLTDYFYREKLNGAIAATEFPWDEFYVVSPWVAIIFLAWVVAFPLLYPIWQGKLSLRNGYELSFAAVLLGFLVTLLVESLPTALYYYHSLLQKDWTISAETWTWLTMVGSVISFVTAGKAAENVSNWSGKLALSVLGLLGPVIMLLIYLRLGALMILDEPLPGGWDLNSWWAAVVTAPIDWLVSLAKWLAPLLGTPEVIEPELKWKFLIGVALLVFAYTRRFVDVNSISLHGFYRDRLSNGYLIDRNAQPNDWQKLSGLNNSNTPAPYHLINVAMNLQGSNDPDLRGRNADFFMFSKQYTGSCRTGFYSTKNLEATDPHLDLGTAMAVSGAAAAPNMGTTTMKSLVFIMTLLNIRLGYWLPNPYVLKRMWYTGPFWGVGPFYLLLELFSWLNEKSRYVNLSDGGHIENLGVYELLRRRCEIIIVGDGEADPNLTFGSLATVMRYAHIDMGIEIEIELDDIRKHADGLSRKHCAIGKIRYPGGETGYLLYVKSSVTGDEIEYIREYRSQHLEFPHESTADQFFDEAQFEAYRALGFHIVDEVFRENVPGKLDKTIAKLEDSLRPRFQMEGAFVSLQEQLSQLEAKFLDPNVSEYTYQIYPELVSDVRTKTMTETARSLQTDLARQSSQSDRISDQVETDEHFRKIFHLCNLQMQLMENVYIALQLDNRENRDHYVNRGWINLFRRWAQAEYFRHAWAVSIGTYGVGYQTFCEEALGLRSWIQWKHGEDRELTHRERYYLREEKTHQRFTSSQVSVAGRTVASSQLWLAQMTVRLVPGNEGFGTAPKNHDGKLFAFPIGIATVNISRYDSDEPAGEKYQAEIMFYRIRDTYRNMGLLGGMMDELRKVLAAEYKELSKFRVNLGRDAEILRRYGYFFERRGFEVVRLAE